MNLLPLPAQAQFVQSNRLEIPLGKDDGFEVIPADTSGLFLYRRIALGSEHRLQLIKLDTACNVTWQGLLPVDNKFELMGKRCYRNKLFLLLRHREIAKKDLELVVIDNNTGSFVKQRVRNFIPFVPTDFQITDKAAIVGGYFNSVPVVIHYSLHAYASKVLPGLMNETGELTQIKTYADGAFDVLISARNFMRQQTIWIKSYDADGNMLQHYPLEPEGSKHLIFARSLKTDNNMQLVAGTYGGRNSDYSKGIFLASIAPNGLQQLRYYNFADLENFFKYMKASREKRVKERIERRKIRGKKLRFNYRFIVHEIVPYNDQFVMLGEAFYPKYVNVDRSHYGGFFNPWFYAAPGSIRNGRIFDGFRYTHAVVMGFDKNGKLMWDNSFEINDVKTYSLEQFVKLETHKDHIALLYVYDNHLRSKIIQGDEVIEGKTLQPLQVGRTGEFARAEKSATSKLNYWYDKYFYAFGVQEVRSESMDDRRVFFINKINYAKAAQD